MERERILERERRWAVPAAVLALVPIVLYIVSIVIVQGADIAGGNSEAEQLTSLHEHAGTVLVSAIVRGIGFLILPIPILYLFLAAKARSPPDVLLRELDNLELPTPANAKAAGR